MPSKPIEEKKIYWDTTSDPSEYPYKIRKIYFKLFNQKKKKISNWLGLNLKKRFNNINNILKPVFSRDPYKSNFFKNIIILLILRKFKQIKKIKLIVFESKSVADVFFKFNKNKKIEVIIKNKNNNLLKIIKSFLFSLLIFLFVKKIKKNFFLRKQKIILFDTYMECGKKEVKDFVFADLNKILKKNKVKNFYFVPTITFTRNIFNLYKNIKFLSNDNYLFKENFLTFNDFIKCFYKSFFQKLNQRKKKSILFESLDCSSMIDHELKDKSDFYSEFQSLLKIYFVEKLKKKKYEIKKSVFRFENQSIDKAWCYAIRKFYPNSEIIGFQGFLYYPHLINQSPTFFENELKVIPKTIIVTNKIAKIKRTEFFKGIKVLIGPSLGKQEIFRRINFSYKYKFVLALCGIKSLDEKMVSWLSYVLKKDKSIKINIKPHPTLSVNKIENFNKDIIKKNCKIIQDKANKMLENSEILISSGPTGIIFESLIYGCKLFYLVLDPSDELMFENIKNKKIFTLIKDKESFFKNIIDFKNKKFIKENNNLKSIFFSKITKKNIKLFY